MREDHDRGAALQSGEILLQPIQLWLAKFAHALKLNNVYKSNKVDTFVIEAIPAIPLCLLAVPVQVHFPVIDRGVMLAGDIKNLPLGPNQDLIESVELSRFRAVGQVAGMNEEIRSNLIRADFVQGSLQCCGDIGIDRL